MLPPLPKDCRTAMACQNLANRQGLYVSNVGACRVDDHVCRQHRRRVLNMHPIGTTDRAQVCMHTRVCRLRTFRNRVVVSFPTR